MPKSMRVAATKLPLKIFTSERNAAKRIQSRDGLRAEGAREGRLGAELLGHERPPREDE